MKISVIGGGSAYTPGLIEGLLKIWSQVPFTEICLMDIDEPKLKTVGAVAAKIIALASGDIKFSITTDRVEAIKGSSFILCQIRVGGLAGRVLDEQIPLKYGIIGQETVGPGGFAMALRTIPVMLSIAEDIKKHAPEAWLINYSNPSGMVAQALARFSPSVKAISICDVPIGIQYFVADALKIPRSRVKLDYVGLNHLGWFRRIFVEGRDIMPQIKFMAQSAEILSMLPADDEKTVEETKMMIKIFKETGLLVSPYIQYYWLTKECLAKQLAAGKTRGEVVQQIEAELLAHFAEVAETDEAHLWKSRGGEWHSELMVNILSAIHNDKSEEYVVNVQNQGCVPGMDFDTFVEIPCMVDKRGARPMVVDALELDMLGLMQMVSAYETLTVEAAVEQSYKKALRALSLNPLVPSLFDSRIILDEYIAAHGQEIRLS